MIEITTVPALKDNYCYLIRRQSWSSALVIDPSEPEPILRTLEKRGLGLFLVLNTHHHHDHVGGNLALQAATGAEIWSSAHDLERVPGARRGLRESETINVAPPGKSDGLSIETLEIPGHTLGQVGFLIREAKALFVGDTIFSMGCGRLFEGSAAQMQKSLAKISSLPADTRIHFGHEYTTRNALFAKAVDPTNSAIDRRVRETEEALALSGVAPAPTLQEELEVNPFFRADHPQIKSTLGLANASALESFTRLRQMRDSF